LIRQIILHSAYRKYQSFLIINDLDFNETAVNQKRERYEIKRES
uniref:DNA repair protein RecO n=1 Tax=Hymenolepis diminuta TaxID=6216 RepID=A0A0R3SK03_HYMDI